MKTSYFANIPFIDTDIYEPISISVYAPDWFVGKQFPQLAPTSSILSRYKRGLINQEQYVVEYTDQVLSKYSAMHIYKKIYGMCPDKEPVLLCYETPKQFCHRHLVSDWFNRAAGKNVRELK